MTDFPFFLAVADSFLDPIGPVAEAQLQHLNFVMLLTLIAIIPPLIATPLIFFRFRRKKPKGTYRPNWDSNPVLEAVMWGVPVIVVILIGISLWKITFRLDPYRELSDDPLQIEVIGLDWKWIFIYPEEKIALVDELIVPEGRAVEMRLTTDTVMQSLRISAVVGQIYAMPAMTTKLNFIVAEEGEARGMNTQFTGAGFWKQKFPVFSVSEKTYKERMEKARQSPLSLTAETYAILAEQGSSEEAKEPLGIAGQEGAIELLLPEQNFFERVLARYRTGEPMRPETQPGSPDYDASKSTLPPAPSKPMMKM